VGSYSNEEKENIKVNLYLSISIGNRGTQLVDILLTSVMQLRF